MNIVDYFKGLAAEGEAQVGSLALQAQANLGRRRALDALDQRIDQLVADGKLDPEERQEIRAQLAAGGADPSAVEALFRELDSSSGDPEALRSRLGQAIKHQRGVAEDDQAAQAIALQFAIEDYRNGIESASSILKNQHDAYMAVIRNIA